MDIYISDTVDAIAAQIEATSSLGECLDHPSFRGAHYYNGALGHSGGESMLESLIKLGYHAGQENKKIFQVCQDSGDHYYFAAHSEEELLAAFQKFKDEE